MLGHERRSKVLAKLTNARCELEDALNLSIPAARYDPVVIPEPLRKRLEAMIDDLKGYCYARSKVRNDENDHGLLAGLTETVALAVRDVAPEQGSELS